MDGIISRTIELSQVLANTLIQGNLREISIRSVIALLKIVSQNYPFLFLKEKGFRVKYYKVLNNHILIIFLVCELIILRVFM